MNYYKACLHIASESRGTKNYPFLSGAEGEGFKNLLFPYVYLRQVLGGLGIDLSTKDINLPEDSFLIFCLDDPHKLEIEKKPGQLWCLIINDPPVYYPESWDRRYHERFDYIFTYDETLVDNEKYLYYPIAQDTKYFSIPELVTEEEFRQRKLATNVSNAIHKYQDPNYPNCTHYRRYETIRWYGENHPDDFRFYGSTFLKRNYYFAFKGVSHVERLLPRRLFSSLARRVQRNMIRVFGGELAPLEKFEVIKKFKFYYCYENTIGINGYVTEKIFDCFYSGIVPIYWGAPNVRDLIPFDCYIDGREFEDEDSLYQFIKKMDYETYRGYLEQAQVFLRSPELTRFTVVNSISCIMAPLMERIRGSRPKLMKDEGSSH